VKVTGQHGETNVIGAMAGERVGRVIEVNGFDVDVPADGYVLVLRNNDVPGVIGRVGTVLGEAEINITSYHQSRGGTGSREALAAIVVDQPPASAVVARLIELSDVLQVTVVNLNGGATDS
jgi:L-serine deaminase